MTMCISVRTVLAKFCRYIWAFWVLPLPFSLLPVFPFFSLVSCQTMGVFNLVREDIEYNRPFRTMARFLSAPPHRLPAVTSCRRLKPCSTWSGRTASLRPGRPSAFCERAR